MMESPVCPNLAGRVHEECSSSWIEIYYKTGKTQMNKNHSFCTKATCFANNLRTSTILPRHTTSGCPCPSHGADPCQFRQTLKSHNIAVVRLDETDDNIDITVCPLLHGMKYFAISHALADGLCNTERNELPECQLRRILQTAKSTISLEKLPQDLPIYVWIDIMCLPLRSSPFDGAATSTFQTLQYVMSNALAVLVLDTDIAVLSRTSSYPECFLKISYSSWGSRLWTLFEAIAAQKLLFECRNGVMGLEDLLETSLLDPATEETSDWPPILYARLQRCRKYHIDDRALLERALDLGQTAVESDSSSLRTTIRSLFGHSRTK